MWDLCEERSEFPVEIKLHGSQTRKQINDKLAFSSERDWKLAYQRELYMDCKFSGPKSREDELVKIENNLVPQCDAWWYLGAILKHYRGFELNAANRISTGCESEDKFAVKQCQVPLWLKRHQSVGSWTCYAIWSWVLAAKKKKTQLILTSIFPFV